MKPWISHPTTSEEKEPMPKWVEEITRPLKECVRLLEELLHQGEQVVFEGMDSGENTTEEGCELWPNCGIPLKENL